MRAVLYCRVSSLEQTKNLSLPTQEKACREYCARNGYDVDRVFVDAGESAKSTDRPEFLRLLTYCRGQRGKVHAVVVYSLTRFSRQQADHHAITTLLRQLGISLRSVTEPIDESPSGKLMEGILAAMAQFDNDARAERTTAGMKAAIERGRWVWRAPLGYQNGHRNGPSLQPDPVLAPLVAEAFTLCAAGVRGRALIKRVTAMGLRTRQGNALTPTTLYPMLQNRAYMGLVRSRQWGCEVKGDFLPLVDEETFWRVQTALAEAPTSTRAIERHRHHPVFPLRRFARCATCHQPLTGSSSKGRSRRYAFYHCRTGCTRLPATVLEAAFLRHLDRLRPSPTRWAFFLAHILDLWESTKRDRGVARTELQRQLAGLTRQAERLDEAFLYEQAIDQTTYQAQRDKLRERIALATLELNDAGGSEQSIEDDLAFARTLHDGARLLWTEAESVERRQHLQWALFPDGIIVARGSTSRGAGGDVEPVIRAVSCLEFFQLQDVLTGDESMASLTSGSWNRIAAWLGHLGRLRTAA